MGYRAGETALIVTVPEAEPVVGGWRTAFDSAAAAGVPAHITVLYPFLNRDQIDAGVLAELAALLAEHRAFDLRLPRCRRFPGVLYLAPVPEAQLRALTHAVAGRWPQAPPYAGRFGDVVPHLTIAQGQEAEVLDMIESDVSGRLPVTARVAAVRLLVCSGDHWQEEQSFVLPASLA